MALKCEVNIIIQPARRFVEGIPTQTHRGAVYGNRTHIPGLEGRCINRYTNTAGGVLISQQALARR